MRKSQNCEKKTKFREKYKTSVKKSQSSEFSALVALGLFRGAESFRSIKPGSGGGRPLTFVVGLGVWRLVVLLVEAVQVSHLRQQLEHALPVVLQRRDLAVKQVQTLQALQVLLQQETSQSKTLLIIIN